MVTNVLNREFNPSDKSRAWVTNVTFIHTDEGWLHLMLDLWSRKVVGWRSSPHNDTDLALRTLKMAVGQRQPSDGWESFFGTMKTELGLKRKRYLSRKEAHDDIVNYIVWYNSGRLHSSLGYVSPNNFESSDLMKNVANDVISTNDND